MVLEEELEKFLLMAPLDLVVVLHNVRLVRGVLGRCALGGKRKREQREQQGEEKLFHGFSDDVAI
jgi:hypothetical protein